jgi:hypothetical protein
MKSKTDKTILKLITEMTKDNQGKTPTIRGANGFSVPFTEENWANIERMTKKSVEKVSRSKK